MENSQPASTPHVLGDAQTPPEPRAPVSPQGSAIAPGRVRGGPQIPQECQEKPCPLLAKYQNGVQQYNAIKAKYEAATAPGFTARMWGKLPSWLSAPLPWVAVAMFSGFGGWAIHPDTTPVVPPPVVKIEPPGALEGEAFRQQVSANDEFLPGLMTPTTRDLWESWEEASHEGD